MRVVWIDGFRYVREDIPAAPVYKVRAYFGDMRYDCKYYGPYHSLADATWQVRCAITDGARSAVVELANA
jgi:hypothetical protein